MAYAQAVMEHGSERRGRRKLHHLEVHPAHNGGHAVHHHYHQGDGAYREPAVHVFGPEEGHEMMKHIAKHAKVKDGWPGENEAEEKAEAGSYVREDEEEGE